MIQSVSGFSPFYLNYGHEPILPIQLIKGDEEISTESIGSFVWRVTSDWELAKENLQRVVGLQQKYYNKKHSGCTICSRRSGAVVHQKPKNEGYPKQA